MDRLKFANQGDTATEKNVSVLISEITLKQYNFIIRF
nr:MAG TPA: hypothetical protein [Bacteriophage sp.]